MSIEITGVVPDRELVDVEIMYLPFSVPHGTKRIEVEYDYSSGNIIDLGLVDSSFEPFPSRTGFRGWSGSVRKHVYVEETDATPGYIKGPILPGTWHVMLGLAKISTKECRYRVEIDLSSEALEATTSVDPSGGTEESVSESQSRWLACDFQSHTEHSDAQATLENSIAAAKAVGLDVLAVTDHNTNSQNLLMNTENIRLLLAADERPLLLMPGEELTTYHGHSNVWGLYDWVDFRFSTNYQYQEIVDHVHERGGLISINHPKTQPGCIGCDWDFEVPPTIDCMEVWQGPWILGNKESLDRYDALLKKGYRIIAVGGSDRHQPGYPDTDPLPVQLGSPTTFVQSKSRSASAVLEGLVAGTVCIGDAPDGPRLDISYSRGGEVVPMGGMISCDTEEVGSLRVTLSKCTGEKLRVVDSIGLVYEGEVTADEIVLENITPNLFIRAEVVVSDTSSYIQRTKKQLSESPQYAKKFDDLLVKTNEENIVRCLSNPIFFLHHKNSAS